MAGDYLSAMSPEEEAQLATAFSQLQSSFPITSQSDEEANPPSPDEEEVEELEEEEEEGDEDEDSSESEVTDDSIELDDGTKLTRAEIKKLHDLQSYLDANPSTRQTLDSTRQYTPPPAPQPVAPVYTAPEPPEGLDLDDPSIKALWENYSGLHNLVLSQQASIAERQNIETRDQVERAISDWNAKYKMDDSTLSSIRAKAGSLNVAAALVANGKSVYEATNAALESAFWSDDAYRSSYLARTATEEATRSKKDRTRTTKLNALSGRGTSPGGSKPPSEMTAQERKDAMIHDIAEHLARN